MNLIHSPAEPGLEERLVDLLIRAGVPEVSASAFMELTPAVVRCAVAGLRADAAPTVASRAPGSCSPRSPGPRSPRGSCRPAPPEILRRLVERGQITADEAELAARVPVAEDVTVEADSGGHTDNRPLAVVLPAMHRAARRAARRHGYSRPIRVGAAGGLGDPAGVAAAFALGAAYVVTGSVNQTRPSRPGCPTRRKAMLAQADLADVAMAPAADMFERASRCRCCGAARCSRRVRVGSTRPTVAHRSLEAIPDADARAAREGGPAAPPFDDVWTQTRRFWLDRDPRELERAERDPRHRMALVFRWYLGLSSRWAIDGGADPADRLPDLVRPGDGRVQPVGGGQFPGRARHGARSCRSRSTCSKARPW